MTRVELVLAYLQMKVSEKRGTRAWTLCPFHQKPTDPNSWATAFFIRLRGTRAGQYHCFTCKNGGGLLELVMHVRGVDVKAAEAAIKLATESYEPPKVRVRFVERSPALGRTRFRMPKEVVYDALEDWPSLARKYVLPRGVTQEEVDIYGLGYAVHGRLAGRFVIPWLDGRRNVAGYSARTFIGKDPKYLTPHPSENPDLGVMVGEHLWPETRNRRIIIVTEGALNGFAIRRVFPEISFGALGGSEINPIHVVKLGTFPRVILVTDPDAAGDKAADALRGMLGRYSALERVRLPSGKDAMDVWRKKPADLRSYLLGALRRAS